MPPDRARCLSGTVPNPKAPGPRACAIEPEAGAHPRKASAGRIEPACCRRRRPHSAWVSLLRGSGQNSRSTTKRGAAASASSSGPGGSISRAAIARRPNSSAIVARLVHDPETVEECAQALPVRVRQVAVDEDPLDYGAFGGGDAGERQDERERELALAQVGEHRLAEALLRSHDVEDVVDDLEAHADVAPVLVERPAMALERRGEVGRQGARRREELGCLPAGDLEVLLAGHADHPLQGKAEDLALGHLGGGEREALHRCDVRDLESEVDRPQVEPVAEEDGELVAPAVVGGGAAAPHRGAVDDVVVDQRGGVDHLHDRAVAEVEVAVITEQARDRQQDRGAQPLAAGLEHVAARLAHELRPAAELLGDEALHEVEPGAHDLEAGRQRGGVRVR